MHCETARLRDCETARVGGLQENVAWRCVCVCVCVNACKRAVPTEVGGGDGSGVHATHPISCIGVEGTANNERHHDHVISTMADNTFVTWHARVSTLAGHAEASAASRIPDFVDLACDRQRNPEHPQKNRIGENGLIISSHATYHMEARVSHHDDIQAKTH